MLPGKGRLHPHHVIKGLTRNDVSLLKAGIIYGANASGKSNFVRAIDFTRKFILRGTTAEQKPIDFKSFLLDKSAINKPSRIEIELKHKGKNYAYGFVVDHLNVYEEWLYEINKTTERVVFERRSEKSKAKINFQGIKFASSGEEQFLRFTGDGTRRNQLFLTECRIRNVRDNVSNISDILNVIDWFQNSLLQ